MFLQSEFYVNADRLGAELDRLRLNYPTLMVRTWKGRYVRPVPIWVIRRSWRDLVKTMTKLSGDIQSLKISTELAGLAMRRFGDAASTMDQSNPDDSSTLDTSACNELPPFQTRIYHKALSLARAVRETVSGSSL